MGKILWTAGGGYPPVLELPCLPAHCAGEERLEDAEVRLALEDGRPLRAGPPDVVRPHLHDQTEALLVGLKEAKNIKKVARARALPS